MKLFSILVAGFALVHGQTDDQIDPRGKERVFLVSIIFYISIILMNFDGITVQGSQNTSNSSEQSKKTYDKMDEWKYWFKISSRK